MFNGKTHYKIFNSYVSLPEGNYLPPFTSGIFQLARFDDTWGILRLISQVFYHNIPMNNLSIIHEEPTVSHLSLPTIYSINNPWKIPVKWQDKSGCIMLYHVISCYITLYHVISGMLTCCAHKVSLGARHLDISISPASALRFSVQPQWTKTRRTRSQEFPEWARLCKDRLEMKDC